MFPFILPKFNHLIMLLFLCTGTAGYSQTKKESIPIELIDNWSMEDSTKKEDYEMMVLTITKDSVGLVYLNFLEAFYGLACTYKVVPMNGITRIKLGNCTPGSKLSSLYCYLKEPSVLAVYFANKEEEKKIPERDTESWLLFTRVPTD